jgi:hypothetical protein
VRREPADAPASPPYRVAAGQSDAPLVDQPDSVWRADATVRRRPWEQLEERQARQERADEEPAAREW